MTELVAFHAPLWLWLLPLSLWLVWRALHVGWLRPLGRLPAWRAGLRYRHPRAAMLSELAQEHSTEAITRHHRHHWLQYAVLLASLHLALAQPYRQGPAIPTPPEARDSVFVIDSSLRLVLKDYQINGEAVDRMTVVKNVLKHFIDQLQGNRIGLVVFSESPYTLVPLTHDYPLLKQAINRLQPAVLTGRSSDIGKALLYTLQQLQAESDDDQARPSLVLVTDVHRSRRDLDPRALAAYLRERGYRLHVIGIGGAGHLEADAQGTGLIYQQVNFGLLEAIAKAGGGSFYRADSVANLQGAITTIQSAERRKISVEPRHIDIPLYHWPLLAALIWLLAIQAWPAGGARQ